MTDFRVGDLLVSSITSTDGYFGGTVIFLLDADESGTVGVVLNRPSALDLDSALPAWASLVSHPRELFDGGPVSQQGAICLAEIPVGAEEPPGWRRVRGQVGLLNLETPVELARGAFEHLRIFAGYAGWDPGQLEQELDFGMWYLVSAMPTDPFDTEPELMWRKVLRRQGGDIGLYSTWPVSVELN